MSWLERILSVCDPFMFSLLLVAFVIFVAMAWNAGFSFNLFTGQVENDNYNGGLGESIDDFEFNLIFYVLLIVVLVGLAYFAYQYFQTHFGVPLAQPAHYQREAVPHHSGVSGAGEKQHSKILVQHKSQGSKSKSTQSGKNK
jgi:hypothetical protein